MPKSGSSSKIDDGPVGWHIDPDRFRTVHQLAVDHPVFRAMRLIPFLLLPEFSMVEMVGIFVDSDLHAPSGVQDVELVINEDMPIMAPVGAAPAYGFGVEDVKFKRYLAGVDSQELFREVTGGLVCHVGSVSICRQRWIFVLPECGIYDTLIRHIRRLAG